MTRLKAKLRKLTWYQCVQQAEQNKIGIGEFGIMVTVFIQDGGNQNLSLDEGNKNEKQQRD